MQSKTAFWLHFHRIVLPGGNRRYRRTNEGKIRAPSERNLLRLKTHERYQLLKRPVSKLWRSPRVSHRRKGSDDGLSALWPPDDLIANPPDDSAPAGKSPARPKSKLPILWGSVVLILIMAAAGVALQWFKKPASNPPMAAIVAPPAVTNSEIPKAPSPAPETNDLFAGPVMLAKNGRQRPDLCGGNGQKQLRPSKVRRQNRTGFAGCAGQ